jgi:hypothetical protein
MALALSVLALVPLVASILFFVRYGRSRTAFNLAVQRFQAEHNAGVSLTTPQASGAA